ncbi:MAG: hypothetical protein ABI954_06690 [Pyrinomonadaceae bacterium]
MLIEREQAETDLLACAAFVAERIGSADGHAASVSDIAFRYAAKGELDLAAGLADEIRDPHTRDVVLSEIAARCADFNDDEYGLQLTEAIEDYGYQQQARHNLAARQAVNGRLEDALATADQMDDSFATIGEIAVRFAHNGDEIRARQLLEQIDFPSVRVQVLNQLAAAKTKSGESAEAVLLESLSESEQIEFAEEQTQLLLEIAERFHDAGQTERAASVLEHAEQLAETLEGRFRDSTLMQIALLFARIGNFEKAEQILEPIEDLQQNASAHAGIALEYQANQDNEHALSSLEEAYAVLKSQPDRAIRDSKSRFNLFSAIAVRFAQFGKPERGLEIALENPDEEPRYSALTNIAAVSAADGKDELARQAVNAIEDYATRIFALTAISDSEAKKGNAEKSEQFLKEAHALSEEVVQLTLRSQALNDIAERFAERGDLAQAAALLHESLQIAQMIVDQSHQVGALVDLAETYEKLDLKPDEKEFEILDLIVRKRLI